MKDEIKERIREDFLYWNKTAHTDEEILEYWVEAVYQAQMNV